MFSVVGEKLRVDSTVKHSVLLDMLVKMCFSTTGNCAIGSYYAFNLIKYSWGSSEYMNNIFRAMSAIPIGDLPHADIFEGYSKHVNLFSRIPLSG